MSATLTSLSLALNAFSVPSLKLGWDWFALIFFGLFVFFVYKGWYSTHVDLQESKNVDYRKHCDKLLEFFKGIGHIEIVSHDERHLINWWKRPEENYCSIPKGKAYRENNETIVRLNMEETEEWDCLKQHLKESPLLEILRDWKIAMSQDLTARKILFNAIVKDIEENQNIPAILNPTQPQEEEPYITYGYVERLYHQVLCQKIGIRCNQIDKGSFQDTKEGKVYLSGEVVTYSDDAAQRENAIDFFLEVQTNMPELTEAEEVRKAYQKSQSETDRLNSEIDKILITGKLPSKSRCQLCPLLG